MKKREKKAFTIINPNAAGIDIASKEHWVAVNPEMADVPIRPFGTYTEDLHKIAEWLKECEVDTVAMEATGIYWLNLFLILEEAGIKTILVNARHTKNVTGKKTDMSDAEWIRQLHSCGLLSASFQPDMFTRELRTYMRHRKNMTQMGATHINMMQKAMEQLNIKLQHVITDITGKSGQAIIGAILAGERDPEKLMVHIDGRIKASRDEIKKSLCAVWKEEHVFELQQSFEMYQQYRRMIIVCDRQIEKLLEQKTNTTNQHSERKTPRNNNNGLYFEAKGMLHQLTGTDLTAIFGIKGTTALELLSEIGWDMGKWPTVKHFTSWLNLAPNNRKSGGKILSSKTKKRKIKQDKYCGWPLIQYNEVKTGWPYFTTG